MPTREIYQRNKEKIKAQRKARLAAMTELEKEEFRLKKRLTLQRFRKNNPNYFRDRQRKYSELNREIVNAKQRLRSKKDSRKLKLEIVKYYSKGKNCCNCCGEGGIIFLSVDHINNDGYKERVNKDGIRTKIQGGYKYYQKLKKDGFPDGFQILCMNCNMGKHLNSGVCPHKDKNYEFASCSAYKKP